MIKGERMKYKALSATVIFTVLILLPSLSSWTGLECTNAADMTKANDWGAFKILGHSITPGESQKFNSMKAARFESAYLDIPVFVARGVVPGPTLCVTAGIHGDEINGVEIARRVFDSVSAIRLKGTLVVLPIMNRYGFLMRQRYMADRMDLNRYFPGRPDGNISSVVAHAVFTKVIKRCDALIDLHTAAFYRTNLPQIRVDLTNPKALEMARYFGAGIILGKPGSKNTLRWQATNAGIPTILYESGESNRFQIEKIKLGVAGVLNVMAYLEMLPTPPRKTGKQETYTTSTWMRVPRGRGGNFFPARELGSRVRKSEVLGAVIDPITSEKVDIRAPFDAMIIGMSIPQVTLSGFILFDLVESGGIAP
jgi:predicted deacylase